MTQNDDYVVRHLGPERGVRTRQHRSFTERTLEAVGIVTTVVFTLWLLWYAADVFLLIFAGILVGVFLSTLSNLLSAHTPLAYHWALAVVVLAIVVIVGLMTWLFGSTVIGQATALRHAVGRGGEQLIESLGAYGWGRQLIEALPAPGEVLRGPSSLMSRVTGIVSTLLGVLSSLVIVVFLGLYLAAEPELYQRGILHLVPCGKWDGARQILHGLGYTIRWWLLGTFTSMTIIGVLTGAALWLIGVPLALTLGLLAGLLEFIPNIGPILAAMPGVLLAYTVSPTKALYVIGLYIVIQALESYLIHPLVLKNTVSLPPAITISSLVLFGVLFGFLGLLLAAPLAAVMVELVKMLYVEDVLRDDTIGIPGEEREDALYAHH
ncbi:MAG: AI-2E family transporter [Chloroflexota bacterium]|nr:AI-2E family transporter [Chloroflexota bacterium]